MEEREQRWKETEEDIKCPLKPGFCLKGEAGIKRDEKWSGHNTVIFAAECMACGRKASGWGAGR